MMEVHVRLPLEMAQFALPEAVQQRLQTLLDQQEQGKPLTQAEQDEAAGLVEMAEFLSLLRMRAERGAHYSGQ